MSTNSNNTLVARIANLSGSEDDWGPYGNHVLAPGEIAVYTPDNKTNYPRFKIGDGHTTIKNLDFFEPDSTRSWVNIDGGNISSYPKKQFTVTFDTDGGTTIAPQITIALETVKKPDDPIKDGYSFTGWFINNIEYDFNTKVTSDLTITAGWVFNS